MLGSHDRKGAPNFPPHDLREFDGSKIVAIAAPPESYQAFRSGIVNPAKYRLQERDWCCRIQKDYFKLALNIHRETKD